MTVGDEDVDERRLTELASLLDGDRHVDWDAAERSAHDHSARAVVSQLRVLASVRRVLRGPGEPAIAGSPTETEEPTYLDARRTWGSLTIIEPIGRGAFGTVYRARDNLNREVALKLFDDQPQHNATHDKRALHEARLLARVRHSNVVIVYGADRFDGRLGLWMELIRGRTLEEELRTRGVLSAQEAKLIGLDLCRALAAVHDAGLLHRDVKARNVMREVGGRIVLMDFGAGVAIDGGESAVDVAGTPLYLAPEIFAQRPASRSSDIYSLGVLLYHLVTGDYPVTGDTPLDILRAHTDGRRTRLRDVRPELPEGFVQTVESALDPDPRRRYQTAGELELAIGASSGSLPTDSVRPTPVSRRIVVRPWMAIAGAAALIVAGVLARSFVFPPATPDAALRVSSAATDGSPSVRAASANDPYTIGASLYKVSGSQRIRLKMDDRVAPGDLLGISIEASRPVHVYVINEDDRGEMYLLFPLKGQESMNPLDPDRPHDLPGRRADAETQWQVTSAGGREHFILFVSPSHVDAFDELLRSLPQPVAGAPISRPVVPKSTTDRLRGIGGLVSRPVSRPSGGPDYLFALASPLRADPETVHGVWVRHISLDNPISK